MTWMTTSQAERPNPSLARIWDALLDGMDNSEADRRIARALAAGHASLAVLAEQNHHFVKAAMRQLSSLYGIRQFVNLGCGCPVTKQDGTRWPMVHEIAQEAHPDARVVYVDTDPFAVAHTAAAVKCAAHVSVIDADLSWPWRVLGAVQRLEEPKRLDLTEPVGVLLTNVLQYWPAASSREIVARYAAGLARGSAVVVSVLRLGEMRAAQRRSLVSFPYHDHAESVVAGYFSAAGLELAGDEVTDIRKWPMRVHGQAGEDRMVGGLGVKA